MRCQLGNIEIVKVNILTTMYLKLIDRELEFKIILLTFLKKNNESVFFEKNNKTLKQTFEQPKYARLKLLFGDQYKEYMDSKLGDFLKLLKESKDSNYLYFLNKYGDKQFCKFEIDTHLEDKGIYCYIKDNQIKYIGRCTNNFKHRINHGYGTIHPKNCFIDGQATNCRLNSLINSTDNVKFGIYIMTDKTTQEINKLEKQILLCKKFEEYEWNIQTS